MRPWLWLWLCMAPSVALAESPVDVQEVDLLRQAGFEVNGIGPVLVRADAPRNRVVVVHSLSSSISLIDGGNDEVTTISTGARGLQHLKSEALAIHGPTGRIYLIANHALVIADPDGGSARAFPTEVQFESVVVDEASGNAFLGSRETGQLGFFAARPRKLGMLEWLQHEEALGNLNQTPPPPLRKVVALPTAGKPGRIVAIDGFEARMYVLDAGRGKLRSSRDLPLQPGGRWHLAGVNEEAAAIYLITETAERKAIQAARIDVDGGDDLVVELTGLSEPVGMLYNAKREEVYVNYDNHPTVQVVDFGAGGALSEIAVPAYGNDAAVLDEEGDVMYLGSWAYGEVEIVDLEEQRFVGRFPHLGIIPHMFTMTFNPGNGDLYFPLGATAVNGCFGAAVTRLDPETGSARKIHTGWAPIDLIEVPDRFLVFGNEDRFAEVYIDGQVRTYQVPHAYPLSAVDGPGDQVYLAYGPHQSYWPVVYIWGARNGVLAIDPTDLSTYDRRIPRQPLDLAVDGEGVLYMPQSNWGTEKQFVIALQDGVRELDIRQRFEMEEEVTRETTQRILRLDEAAGWLYLLRAGERDDEPSVLQVIDRADGSLVQRVELGANATDLLFDEEKIHVACFSAGTVEVIDKGTWTVETLQAGQSPLKLCRLGDHVYAIDHLGNALHEVGGEAVPLPPVGHPDALFAWGEQLVVIVHAPLEMVVLLYDPQTATFEVAHRLSYPFGDTRFDGNNSAFYMSGQYGDAVFDLTRGRIAQDDSLWLADFLSGKVLILSR